ncbi:MAG: trypsin-like peptidase domain-containing protein [Clostridia bacterium]|nr:trypsin-like peptidase domain-containing protein [Clostridia bacterium]
MKSIRALLSITIATAILLASALSSVAIEFDAEKVYESVFVIYSGSSLGSGFAVGQNCIVTNAHVIGNEKSVRVTTYGGTEHQAYVLGMDEHEDIAVLVVEDVEFPLLEFADTSAIKPGDDIYAIGAPKGMAYTLTKGSVSAKERIIGSSSYIQIDAAINEGNSGGPLLNDYGCVIGMNTMKISDSEGIGLAIPITKICEYIESLGITLNGVGNVEGIIAIPESLFPTEDAIARQTPIPDTEDEERPDVVTSPITYVALVAAGVSIAANVVLAVLLTKQKRKCLALINASKERTDFDIEIWE